MLGLTLTLLFLASWAPTDVATAGSSAPLPPASAAPSTAPTTAPATRPARRRFGAAPAPATQHVTHSIPGLAAQLRAESKIREIYASDYADASFNARRALARRLITASAQTQRDTDAKFVLLREARDVAAAAGDVTTAFDAIDRLVESFPVVRLHERVEVLKKSVAVLATSKADLAAVSLCMDLTDQCIVEGDYDRADVLLSLATECTRRAKSRPHAEWIMARSAAISPLKQAYEIARPAERRLAQSPNDPDANLLMGQFVSFVKNDFDAGLPMLARGSDPVLARLADEDLDMLPDRPAAHLKLADAWWNVAATQPPEYRAGARRRAGYWYRQAAPKLDGLDRALAERRLIEVFPPPPAPGARTSAARPPDALKLNRHWYRASIADVTWETARRLCEESGGRLVSVETRVEGELMTKLARGRTLWLGASFDPARMRWTWLSGAEMFFTNWASGEPSSTSADSHPVTASGNAWRTSTGRAGFICEWSE
jgi:hypothetical protein